MLSSHSQSSFDARECEEKKADTSKEAQSSANELKKRELDQSNMVDTRSLQKQTS